MHVHSWSLTGRVIDAVTVRAGRLGDGPELRVTNEDDAATVALLSELSESWLILDRWSPVFARWLERYVQRVVLVPNFGPRASYRHFSRSVFLRSDSAAAHDALALAAILAHESTHARICARLGPFVFSRKVRTRIEHRCVSEQLAVLLVRDESHYLVDWSRQLLEDFGRRTGRER